MKRLALALLFLFSLGAAPAHATTDAAIQIHAQHVAEWGCGVSGGYC